MMSFNIFVFPHIVSSLVLFALSIYSFRHRKIPMATPFALLMLAAGLWCLFYSLEICSVDYSLKLIWAQARFIGLAPLSTLWLAVGIQHIGTIKWFRGVRWLILAIVPFSVIILSLTSSYHTLFRYNYSLLQNTQVSLIIFKNGPLFWIYAIYSYFMAGITGIILYRSFKGRSIIRHRQTVFVISGIALFIIVDILFQAGITPIKQYTLSPAALGISGILMGLAVFQYRILDLAPITQSMVMNGISDIILVADDTDRLIEFNRAASELFGLDIYSSTGMFIYEIHPFFSGICRSDKGVFDAHLKINNTGKDFEVSVEPVYFGGKHVVGTLVHLRDVTEHKRMEREIRQRNVELTDKIEKIEALQIQLREQAIRDPLTGLFNRRYMDEMIERDFSLAQRTGIPLSFTMIDIDYFKSVNDTWGHQAGDSLLKALAAMLTEKTRKSDIVCRYGGEEFLIVLNGVASLQAHSMIENIRMSFELLITLHHDIEIKTTFSAGIASFPEHGDDAWSIIRIADEALYIAKHEGRNRVIISPV